ncbi:hypothetical protein DVH05_011522 [Phytophthora capsici]|nr:hypothetical protein DVH05_011522 [Phytophthora capsici]
MLVGSPYAMELGLSPAFGLWVVACATGALTRENSGCLGVCKCLPTGTTLPIVDWVVVVGASEKAEV